MLSGEHATVGGEGEAHVGERDLDGARIRRHGRVVVEVLAGAHAATVAASGVGTLEPMAAYDIRVIGDPVLRQRAKDVTDMDGALAKVVDDMLETMYEAPGIGLAAPQVGINKRLFVWDIGMGPNAMINPEIVEGDGEWVFEEGCLSVPGLSWEIVRPKKIHIVGHSTGAILLAALLEGLQDEWGEDAPRVQTCCLLAPACRCCSSP